MDCEACTDRLVDLLYGELDDAAAEAMRAHLAQCAACGAAYARVSRGRELASFLTMEEPPPAVRVSVLAAARERAQGRTSKPESVERPFQAAAREADERDEDDGEDGGLWSKLMRWLGGLAMGPQVAMAMMLLLMVGIGLWYLPELRRHDPADVHAIVDPAAGDEVGPSQGLEPAAPLDLEADPRTGRIRPREEERAQPAPRVARAHPAMPAEPLPPTPTPAAEARMEPEVAAAERVEHAEPRVPRQPSQQQAVLDEPLESPESSLAELEVAPGQSAFGAEEQAPAVRPTVAPPSAPAYAMSAQRSAAGQAAPAPQLAPAPPTETPRTAESSDAIYRRGLQRFEQRDYRGAANDFESVIERPDTDARRLLPSALHHLASSQSAAGNCPRAIGSYEQLLSRYPAYSEASTARIELADCYRRTGQISRARAVLENASRDARVASRAQRELLRLEAAERAMDRGTETARTPDRPAPAPSRAHDDEFSGD